MKHQIRISTRIAAIVLALATTASMTAAYAGKKVGICHIPPGNPENAQTIFVAISAWTAHQAHGDTLGDCPEQPEPAPVDSGGGGSGGSTVADSFVVVLCDGRKGEQGRTISVSETGRVTVSEAECH